MVLSRGSLRLNALSTVRPPTPESNTPIALWLAGRTVGVAITNRAEPRGREGPPPAGCSGNYCALSATVSGVEFESTNTTAVTVTVGGLVALDKYRIPLCEVALKTTW